MRKTERSLLEVIRSAKLTCDMPARSQGLIELPTN